MSVLVFLFSDLTPASAVSGSVGAYASCCSLLYLTYDADDPRPALRRSAESGRLLPVWQTAVHAGHDVNFVIGTGHLAARRVLRNAAITAAALLALLTITPGDAR